MIDRYRCHKTRAGGLMVPSDEVPRYLGGGWKVACDEDGPVYCYHWAMLVPPRSIQERPVHLGSMSRSNGGVA